jgi:hypothetical protein
MRYLGLGNVVAGAVRQRAGSDAAGQVDRERRTAARGRRQAIPPIRCLGGHPARYSTFVMGLKIPSGAASMAYGPPGFAA